MSGRIVMYCRKSSDKSSDKQVHSLERQNMECQELLMKHRIPIKEVEVLEEEKSAWKKGRRPIFSNLLKDINKGGVNTLVCYSLNRLTRNDYEEGILKECLREDKLSRVISIEGVFDASNIMIFGIHLSIAVQYSSDLSKNVKSGLKKRRFDGWHGAVAPLGYTNVEKGMQNVIDKDPERFESVRRFFEKMATGLYTQADLLQIINNEWGFRTPKRRVVGGGKLSKTCLNNLLRNPFYYGWLSQGDYQGWGSHEPMITKELFDKVQEVIGYSPLSKTKKTAKRAKELPYKGHIRCGHCGKVMTTDQKKGIDYYCCSGKRNKTSPNCIQKYVRREKIEDHIKSVLASIKIPKVFEPVLMKVVQSELQEAQKEEVKHQGSNESQLKRIKIKKQKLIDSKMEPDSPISQNEFETQMMLYTEEEKRLIEVVRINSEKQNYCCTNKNSFFRLINRPDEWFEKITKEAKNRLLLALGHDYQLKNTTLSFTLNTAIQQFL